MRCVREAEPRWWVMEAVKQWDLASLLGLVPSSLAERLAPVHQVTLSPRWLGEEQSRKRFFHSNLHLTPFVEVEVFEPQTFKHAVLAGHGGGVGSIKRGMAKYTFAEACRLQGLPEGFDLPGFTRQAAYEAVGNGVPMVMGRAIARAVKRALAVQRAQVP